MDLGTASSLAGLVASLGIAAYQRREAAIARERAATLEAHLSRQRWQQLRSIGEQVDVIERAGRHIHSAPEAALYARLREQYASLLGVIATSTPGFSPRTVRTWVQVGRLTRPWQIAEAVSHLEAPGAHAGDDESDARQELEALSRDVVGRPTAIREPKRPDEYVAAYILLGHRFRTELKALLSVGGQSAHTATVLLDLLAEDCLQSALAHEPGLALFRCWGFAERKPFRERYGHYDRQDFWVVKQASSAVQSRLEGYERFFEFGATFSYMVIPTVEGAEAIVAAFPQLAKPVSESCTA